MRDKIIAKDKIHLQELIQQEMYYMVMNVP